MRSLILLKLQCFLNRTESNIYDSIANKKETKLFILQLWNCAKLLGISKELSARYYPLLNIQ